MARQVRFVVVREDLQRFLEFADEHGFQAIPAVVEPDGIPVPQRPSKARFHLDFFFLLPKVFHVVEAFYDEVLEEEPDLSVILVETSPVIEVTPSRASSDTPEEGRICFAQTADDPRYADALKAYKLLAGFFGDWPKNADGIRIGPHATKVIEASKKRKQK